MTHQTPSRHIYRVITAWHNHALGQNFCLVERGALDEHFRFTATSWKRYRLTPSSARRLAALRIVGGWPC